MSNLASNREANGRFKKGTHWRPHVAFREYGYLLQEYVECGRSAVDIANEHGVHQNAIFYWLKKNGIPGRSMSETRAKKHWGASGPSNPMFGKTGQLNPHWIDGSSPERQSAYAKWENKTFNNAIKDRDNYSCCRCGEPKGGPRSLHVHHIRAWAGNPELRFDADNVVCLCRKCHRWVHSNANKTQDFVK